MIDAVVLKDMLEANIAKAEAMGCRLDPPDARVWWNPGTKCGCLFGLATVGRAPHLSLFRGIGTDVIKDVLGLSTNAVGGGVHGFEGQPRAADVGRFPDYDAGYAAGTAIRMKRFPDRFADAATEAS